jgi:hypothetical protein
VAQPGLIEISKPALLRHSDGTYGYKNDRYGARLGDGYAQVAALSRRAAIGVPELAFILEDARMGGAVIAQGGAVAPKVDEQSTVHYVRPGIDEVYQPREEGLEQSFVVRELPPERSALTVTGLVSTNLVPPQEGTTSARLSFRDGDQVHIWRPDW